MTVTPIAAARAPEPSETPAQKAQRYADKSRHAAEEAVDGVLEQFDWLRGEAHAVAELADAHGGERELIRQAAVAMDQAVAGIAAIRKRDRR